MSTFTPEPDWIDVRGGAILPDGSEIQMDMTTGRQQARRADAGEATRQGHHAGDKISRVADSDEISRFVDALFRYSTEGTYVALHSFYHDPRRPPADARKHKLQSSEALIKLAAQRATYVANLPEPTVFAPPICTFASKSSAAEANLAGGLALSVECDAKPEDARRLLEGLLDRATIAVASGGTWIDPATGETHKKLHLHWRLAEPTREASDHQLLKRARRLAALLAESDSTAIPMVHPLRWPGTWHLKSEPILARIVQCDPDQEVHLEDVLDALEGAANMRGIPLDDQPHRTNANAPLAGDDDLAALARAIPNDAATYWESWNNTGMAFWAASGGSDAGFEAFDGWSAKRGEIYDAETTAARWQHWHTSPPTKLTIGKLVYLARQAKPDFRLPSWQTPKDEAEPSDHATAFPRDDWEQPLLGAVEELNVKHSVVTVGGQTSIATWEHNDALERDRLVFSREQDIKLRYRHRHLDRSCNACSVTTRCRSAIPLISRDGSTAIWWTSCSVRG